MYAVIEFAGHQYKVQEGDKLEINSLDAKEGSTVTVDTVLMTFDEDGKNTSIGAPYLDGTTVELKVLDHLKGDKVRVYKMKAKKRYRRNKGHRQALSAVEVVKVGGAKKSPVKKEAPKKTVAKETVEKKAPAKKKAE